MPQETWYIVLEWGQKLCQQFYVIYPNVLLIPILKVYDKNVDRNEIIMDLDLVFASDAEIKFSLKGISAKISDFSLKGKELQNSLSVNCQRKVN